MVHQEAIHHGFAVAVHKHRLAEDLHRVQGWRRRQADLDGVKHLQHSPVLRHIIVEIPETQFPLTQVPVEQVAPVAFIHHDQVVGVNRGLVFLAAEQQPLHHCLHGGDLHPGVGFGLPLAQVLDAIDVGKALQAFHPRFLEGIGGLAAQFGAINQKQHPPKPAGFEQAVDQGDAGFCFACAGGHRQHDVPLARCNRRFGGLDRTALVGPQRKAKAERFPPQLLMGQVHVLARQRLETFG